MSSEDVFVRVFIIENFEGKQPNFMSSPKNMFKNPIFESLWIYNIH